MKIISLQVENVKRVKAVRVIPGGNVVLVTGKNGAGKSSVLDSIMYALAGGKSLPEKPIREGQHKARIEIDLGDYKVTRSFTEKGSYLNIEGKEGMKASNPQQFLNSILGKISFDPLAFINEAPKKQREIVLDMVGLDLSDFDDHITAVKGERSDLNKEIARLKNEVDRIGISEDVPDELVSVAALTEELNKALEHNRKTEQLWEEIAELDTDLYTANNAIKKLEEELVLRRGFVSQIEAYIAELKEKIPSALIDTNGITDQIKSAETINEQVRSKLDKERLQQELEEAQNAYKVKGDEIQKTEQRKVKALAKAKMPIEGLGVSDEGVTYGDVPIKQISQGEALRVGVAVSMALNPKLRVLRIMDGSLLDKDNLKAIAKMVVEKDYQVWIEKVDDSGQVGIYIEDGEVKE